MTDDKTPIFLLDFGGDGTLKVGLRDASGLTEEMREERARVLSDPRTQAFLRRADEVHAKGVPALALTEGPLGHGAVARVLVDRGAEYPRLLVIPEATLSDDVLAKAELALRRFELQTREGEAGDLLVFGDGRVQVTRAGVVKEFQLNVISSRAPGEPSGAEAIRARASTVSARDVAGVGPARVLLPLRRPDRVK